MRIYIRYILYLVVFIGFTASYAGSYEDFFEATRRDDASVVRALLARGFDPNTPSPNGEAGLVLAVRERSFKVITVLLENPLTQVEKRTTNDESALMLAALRGYFDVCKELIARDADVNKPGWTPLHYAATSGHTQIMRLLLDHHAYIDASSPNGSTPLMMAAMYGTSNAVQLLLDAGADPSIKNGLGLTAIDFAMRVQRDEIAAAIAKAVRARRKGGDW